LGTEPRGDLTAILDAARSGGADARERLVRAIYAELRRTAGVLMRHEQPGHTLQPSALVHEALLRLLDGDALADVPNRPCLFAAAAQAMRQVLVDHARRCQTRKRDGNRVRVPLDRVLAGFDEQGFDVIALHEALEGLAQARPRPARVVDLRFFGGLTVPKVAAMLDVSDTTVEAHWRFARAWLRDRLGGTPA
jgi:RNA polymerase sigma factor (TIGR02999 family)